MPTPITGIALLEKDGDIVRFEWNLLEKTQLVFIASAIGTSDYHTGGVTRALARIRWAQLIESGYVVTVRATKDV